MKARKKGSNDEWENVSYVQLEGSSIIYKEEYLEFDNLSTEIKTCDQVDEEKHWKAVRERASIAAMQGIINHGEIPDILIARTAVRHADELVKQLKGE